VQTAHREGRPVPAAVRNAPILELGLELYWEAFGDLNTCRSATMDGALPIPWTAATLWAKTHKLDDEQAFDLWYFIRKMDSVYLSDEQDQRKKSRKAK
jgi:hypothetical protein